MFAVGLGFFERGRIWDRPKVDTPAWGLCSLLNWEFLRGGEFGIGQKLIPPQGGCVRHRCLTNGATQVNTAVVQIILNHTCHHTCDHTSVMGSPSEVFQRLPRCPTPTPTPPTTHHPLVGYVLPVMDFRKSMTGSMTGSVTS